MVEDSHQEDEPAKPYVMLIAFDHTLITRVIAIPSQKGNGDKVLQQ